MWGQSGTATENVCSSALNEYNYIQFFEAYSILGMFETLQIY
jgi:hypothetical protein